jgi:hydroxymethylpyrimidine pyrophosphatase-like HAD family hydrolase
MTRIALVVSDVDGTLLTKDKVLTEAAKAAVRRLHEAGIGFTITSSRPTIGMRFLIEPLQIKLPIGAFNGSSIVDPQLGPVEQNLIPLPAVQRCLEVLNEFGVDIWLFTNDLWLTRNGNGEYVAHEQHTIRADPTIVADFTPYLSAACKIVGSSPDPALLQRCEAAMQKALGAEANAVRSQSYYLARQRQGHLRAGDRQAPRRCNRHRRHHRRHAERPGDVSPERPLLCDGECHRRRQESRHACHHVKRKRRFCRRDGDDFEG